MKRKTYGQHRFINKSPEELEILKQEYLEIPLADFMNKYHIGHIYLLKLFGKKKYKIYTKQKKIKTAIEKREYAKSRRDNEYTRINKNYELAIAKFNTTKNKISKLLEFFTFSEILNADSLDNIKTLYLIR